MANYLPNGSVYTGDTHYTSGVLMTGAIHSSDSQALTTTQDSQTNPQITNGRTPLRTLSMQALRRFGDFNATTIDGDVLLMFIEFANMIIDDIRMHPYAPRTTYSTTSGDNTTTSTSIDPLSYYKSIDESREIDDQIVVAGLLAHYSLQQGSDKIEIYMPNYQRTLNQQLWRSLNGNTEIRMRVMDNGSNPRNINRMKTSTTNGTVSL